MGFLIFLEFPIGPFPTQNCDLIFREVYTKGDMLIFLFRLVSFKWTLHKEALRLLPSLRSRLDYLLIFIPIFVLPLWVLHHYGRFLGFWMRRLTGHYGGLLVVKVSWNWNHFEMRVQTRTVLIGFYFSVWQQSGENNWNGMGPSQGSYRTWPVKIISSLCYTGYKRRPRWHRVLRECFGVDSASRLPSV